MTYFQKGTNKIDFENTSTRLLIGFAFDQSGSMGEIQSGSYVSTGKTIVDDGKTYELVTGGESKVTALQKSFQAFRSAILADEEAMYATEISAVGFSSTVTDIVPEFTPIEELGEVKFTSSGNTIIGSGVNAALDKIDARKKLLKEAGMQLYIPWLVIMTDGYSYGEDTSKYEAAIKRCRDLVERNKLIVFPIAIGKSAEASELQRFSPKMNVLKLEDGSQLQLKEFFEFLSSSASEIATASVRSEFIVKSWNELAE